MLTVLLQFVIAVTQTNALLRFPCAQFTVTRSDPLISPGNVSGHLHQVVGGSGFDFNMPINSTNLPSSTCTSCSINENKSNYWSPTLYFQSPVNGTFKRVAQKPGPLTGNPNAGMVVYYIQVGSVTSFPQNFRMLTGDPFLRVYNSSFDDSRSIMFRCLASDESSGPDTNGMPTTNCVGGIRSQLNFPTCWNGKDIDTANHKDHVAYATGASFGNFGTGCPSTHPVTIPLLYFETYWDTAPYASSWVNGKSPFVWSMGDPTGYGYHADYMMGWPEATLKAAMAQCNDQSGQVSACPMLTSRSEQAMNDCAVANRVDEGLDGWLAELPGCNPVQAGPARATPASGCGAPTATLPASSVSFLTSDISGWTPVGCASENSGENLLSGARTTMSGMTVESCLNYCNTHGMAFAGLKSQTTCACGASVDTSKFSAGYACNLVCPGNLNEYCGAANRIAVYSGKGAIALPSTTPSAPTTTPTTPSTGQTQSKYGQCGGIGWTGPTVCAAGSTCKVSNPYYSQCL
ncbi:hypothetical protein C8J56DRAFT_914678 [Mycena floridula]|nr:hypothetical protein C8J56DRAFT_914678 [Mycena floridula]